MVWIMPSTRRRRASSISATSAQRCFNTGSPNVRIAKGATDLTLRDRAFNAPSLRQVPGADCSPRMLVAEDRDRGRVEEEVTRFSRGETEEGGGQDAQEMTVAEQGDVTVTVLGPQLIEQAS